MMTKNFPWSISSKIVEKSIVPRVIVDSKIDEGKSISDERCFYFQLVGDIINVFLIISSFA